MLLKKKLFLVTSIIVVFFLSACAEKEKLDDGSELINKNQFVFAASGEFKPFSYINDDLTMSGFDIEVGEAVRRKWALNQFRSELNSKGL